MVVLHGFLGSARNLASFAHQLAQSDPTLSAFSLDLPGHGASPPLALGADLTALAGAVLATARDLAGHAALTIVGHSLGGRVALAACLLEPASIAHVTLLDIAPSPLRRPGDSTEVVEALETAPAHAESREAFRAHLRQRGLSADVTEWLLMNLARDDHGFGWRIDRQALVDLHRRTGAEDLWPAVEGSRAYGLHCVRGGRSPFVDDTDAQRLEAAGCPVDTVEGAGHLLHVEEPARVLALVRARLGDQRDR